MDRTRHQVLDALQQSSDVHTQHYLAVIIPTSIKFAHVYVFANTYPGAECGQLGFIVFVGSPEIGDVTAAWRGWPGKGARRHSRRHACQACRIIKMQEVLAVAIHAAGKSTPKVPPLIQPPVVRTVCGSQRIRLNRGDTPKIPAWLFTVDF
jgi:hypothetical protein